MLTPVEQIIFIALVLICGALAFHGFSRMLKIVRSGLEVKLHPQLARRLVKAFSIDDSLSTESIEAPGTDGKIRFKKLILPETADVDITTQDVLVAVGRGIGSKDNVEVAVELADALGAAVAASRPLTDAGWLPKSRQVGKSGVKVKPKLYLALGISGAPEHIEGMKSSSTIIAINTDKNAPIFDVAHYGMVADLFDVCEELMDLIE